MPRIDRTFTDGDVLRIIAEHLDPDERRRVLDGLQIISRRSLLEDLLDELTSFLPFIGTILDVADVLTVFFNRADVQRAREASAFISERRDALRRALNEAVDF
jgi:hypothetical protein